MISAHYHVRGANNIVKVYVQNDMYNTKLTTYYCTGINLHIFNLLNKLSQATFKLLHNATSKPNNYSIRNSCFTPHVTEDMYAHVMTDDIKF